MKCQSAQQQLSEYLDGTLSASARGRLEAHLEACAPCRRQRDDLQQTVRLVAQLGRMTCPVDCRGPVLARLEAPEAKPGFSPWAYLPRLPRLVGAGLAATAAACGVAVGLHFWPGERPPELHLTPPPPAVAIDPGTWHDATRTEQALGSTDSMILAAPETVPGASAEPH